MPIYEYRCPDCGHQFDALQKMKDEIDRYLVETEGVDGKDMDITFPGKDRKGKRGKGKGKNGGKKGSDQQHAKGGGKSWWKKPQWKQQQS